MESRVIALEECLKETEKRLDAVDQKVDEAFKEAEDIRNEDKGIFHAGSIGIWKGY